MRNPSFCKLFNSVAVPVLIFRRKRFSTHGSLRIAKQCPNRTCVTARKRWKSRQCSGFGKNSMVSCFLILFFTCLGECGETLFCNNNTYFKLTKTGHFWLSFSYIRRKKCCSTTWNQFKVDYTLKLPPNTLRRLLWLILREINPFFVTNYISMDKTVMTWILE